jgi:hypothetical protein
MYRLSIKRERKEEDKKEEMSLKQSLQLEEWKGTRGRKIMEKTGKPSIFQQLHCRLT